MYESREMVFLLASVLVVEKGKRQYSAGFEHFVVLRKNISRLYNFLAAYQQKPWPSNWNTNVKNWWRSLIAVGEFMMNVKESLVDGGMVQFQFQLKASTGQLPSPPGCKPASEDPGFKELEVQLLWKCWLLLKFVFFFLGVFQQWHALVPFAMLCLYALISSA